MSEQDYRCEYIYPGDRGIMNVDPYTRELAFMQEAIFVENGYEQSNPKMTLESTIANLKIQTKSWVGAIIIIDVNEELVGFSALAHSSAKRRFPTLDLAYAYISPDFRKRGLYREMIDRRIEMAREYGAQRVEIQNYNHTFQPKFLSRYGFRRAHDSDGSFYRLDI